MPGSGCVGALTVRHTYLLVFAPLMLALAYGGCARSRGSGGFAPHGGGFSVQMPGKPEVAQNTLNTPVGPMTVYHFSHETPAVIYGLTYSDAPPDLAARFSPEVLVEAGVRNAVTTLGGRLTSQRALRLNGYPGREFVLERSELSTGRIRLFQVRERTYTIYAISPKDQVTSAPVVRYLESFRLQNP